MDDDFQKALDPVSEFFEKTLKTMLEIGGKELPYIYSSYEIVNQQFQSRTNSLNNFNQN